MSGRKPGASSRGHATQAPAVTRAVAILAVLSKSPEPLGVSAIARQVDLIPSSCLHILRALAGDEGMDRRRPDEQVGVLGRHIPGPLIRLDCLI